jgi:hypothetical protein
MRCAGLRGTFVLISSVALADEFNSSSGEAARVLIQSEPSGSGGVSPRCLGSVNPFAFDDPNGFAKFLRNCLEQPAYADTPPFQLSAGRYDVYAARSTPQYTGEPLRPIGSATISAFGPNYQVLYAVGNKPPAIYLAQPGKPIKDEGGYPGRMYLNIGVKAAQSPANTPWQRVTPPQPVRYILRVSGAIEYDVYYRNDRCSSETWIRQ